MKAGNATGLQIAFLTFAVLLLVVPFSRWVSGWYPGPSEYRQLIDKAIPFFIAAMVLLSVAPLRRWCHRELGRPLSAQGWSEAIVAAVANLVLSFAVAGGLALMHWLSGGPSGLAQWVRTIRSAEAELAHAFSLPGVAHILLIGVVLAPILEEFIFRGLLYRAWERRWGWIPAMGLTSIVFAAYHPIFAAAFVSSVLYVCVYRRTGTLRGPMVTHALHNLLLWYPLAGQYLFPHELDSPGDLGVWRLHLACLLLASIALPAYVWLSRNADDASDTALECEREPVPQ